MKKRIFVTGLHGYIGSRFAQMAGKGLEIIDINRKGKRYDAPSVIESRKVDILDSELLLRTMDREDADSVVHFAAKTHIDACQKDRHFNKESETWRINVEGTKNIAKIAKKLKKKVIFLSTECVFDGKEGNYRENDLPHPINFYGETKLRGEEEIQKSCSSFCIVRSVLSYGHVNPFPVDLIRTYLVALQKEKTVSAVRDQYINPTFIDDLVHVILLSIDRSLTGIYHFGGSDITTPYDLAVLFQKALNLPGNVRPCTLIDFFPTSAQFRLKRATLDSNKLQRETHFYATEQKKIFSILADRIDSADSNENS